MKKHLVRKYLATAALAVAVMVGAALPAKATTWTLILFGYTAGTGTANGTVGPLTIYHVPTALFSSLANCQAQLPSFTGNNSPITNTTATIWAACLTAG